MDKQKAYEYVNKHWVFDKNNYPILKELNRSQDKDFAFNFKLKHCLLHVQKNYDNVFNNYVMSSKSLRAFGHPTLLLEDKFIMSLLKIAITSLKMKGIYQSFNHKAEFKEQCHSFIENNTLCYMVSLNHMIKTIASHCENCDHGGEPQHKRVYLSIEIFLDSLEKDFSAQGLSIPWRLVPEVMKK